MMRSEEYDASAITSQWYRPSMVRAVLLLSAVLWGSVQAGQWSTYRANPMRSGAIENTVGPTLSLQWKYVPVHPPKPAWPLPSEEMPRMHNDNAYHTVVADGMVYWGSSVTNKVYAVDAARGKLQWSFVTEGPIRFAPTISNKRVYVGSDDGYVYCLDARKGVLKWKYRPGPSNEKIIGNGRMISLWPVRTGVLVDDNVAFCGTGVFPYEGIYLCALDATDGSVIWKNDTIGDQAHEIDYGGISPQGYLVASKDVLYFPSGRAMPAGFDRRTGKFLFFASPGGKRGGTWALLDQNRLIAGIDSSGTPHKAAYDSQTGRRQGDAFAWFPGIDMVVNNHHSYLVTQQGIYAINRAVFSKAEREAKALSDRRNALNKKLDKLKSGLRTAQAAERAEIEQQIKSTSGTIGELAAAEKKEKDSSFEWFHAGGGYRSVILTGDILYVGGIERVVGIEVESGKKVWQESIDGTAVSMAAASGKLIVSSNEGPVYCFGARKRKKEKVIGPKVNRDPYPEDDRTEFYRKAAERIITDSGITKGYALVLECNTGRLAYELAQRTDLKIVGLEKDPHKRQAAQQKLEQAGLLGARVVVEPWSIEDLPPYFANLITSEGMLTSGRVSVAREQLGHVLRPYGGMIVAGFPDSETDSQKWFTFERPALEGATGWTQQYGNPQNTACSNDETVKGPLGLLWYGEPGSQQMVERHAKAQSPLAMDGRLFVQGEEVVMAYDAFNGALLWRREIPGAVRARADIDGGNLVLTEDALYVAANDLCHRLDPATGETVRQYSVPEAADGAARRWGYVSCAGNLLIGIRTLRLKQGYAAEFRAKYPQPDDAVGWAYKRSNAKWHSMTTFPKWENYSSDAGSITDNMLTGDMVFAVNPDTGEIMWRHTGKRIANITASIGNGKVFFAESAVTNAQRESAITERSDFISKGKYVESEKMKKLGNKYKAVDIRVAVALDLATGRKIWERAVDFTGCCGDAMGSAFQDDVLLFFGCIGNHDAYRFREGQLTFRRIVALSAIDSRMLWSRPCNYRTRPVVMNQTIILEPQACDLHTGEITLRTDPVTGKENPWEFLRPGHTCAISSASASTLFYRSSCSAMYDIERDSGVVLFGGIRPGCWISMIPASGLLLAPEASSGCTCSYPLRCSFALVRKPKRERPWSVFVNQTLLDEKGGVIPSTYDTPVKHLAVNFGAPADKKDEHGTLWFGYPNPRTVYTKNHFSNYGVKFDLQETILEGMGYFRSTSLGRNIEGTNTPWLFTSGCTGLTSCMVPLTETKQEPGVYTVRLGFCAPAGDKAGQRVFDIKLQDKIVLRNFDITRDAGQSGKSVVKEFSAIPVVDNLKLELVPQNGNPRKQHAPVISFLEIIEGSGS